MKTKDIIQELAKCEEGKGWIVIVTEDTISSIFGGYGGEQDGSQPIKFERDQYGDLEGWENDADLWCEIEEACEKQGLILER